MDPLQTALESLRAQFGDFDNFKLLLDGGESVSTETVAAELLKIAQGMASGEIVPETGFDEAALRGSVLAL